VADRGGSKVGNEVSVAILSANINLDDDPNFPEGEDGLCPIEVETENVFSLSANTTVAGQDFSIVSTGASAGQLQATTKNAYIIDSKAYMEVELEDQTALAGAIVLAFGLSGAAFAGYTVIPGDLINGLVLDLPDSNVVVNPLASVTPLVFGITLDPTTGDIDLYDTEGNVMYTLNSPSLLAAMNAGLPIYYIFGGASEGGAANFVNGNMNVGNREFAHGLPSGAKRFCEFTAQKAGNGFYQANAIGDTSISVDFREATITKGGASAPSLTATIGTGLLFPAIDYLNNVFEVFVQSSSGDMFGGSFLNAAAGIDFLFSGGTQFGINAIDNALSIGSNSILPASEYQQELAIISNREAGANYIQGVILNGTAKILAGSDDTPTARAFYKFDGEPLVIFDPVKLPPNSSSSTVFVTDLNVIQSSSNAPGSDEATIRTNSEEGQYIGVYPDGSNDIQDDPISTTAPETRVAQFEDDTFYTQSPTTPPQIQNSNTRLRVDNDSGSGMVVLTHTRLHAQETDSNMIVVGVNLTTLVTSVGYQFGLQAVNKRATAISVSIDSGDLIAESEDDSVSLGQENVSATYTAAVNDRWFIQYDPSNQRFRGILFRGAVSSVSAWVDAAGNDGSWNGIAWMPRVGHINVPNGEILEIDTVFTASQMSNDEKTFFDGSFDLEGTEIEP